MNINLRTEMEREVYLENNFLYWASDILVLD
jgi:hypothetical protein